MRLKINILCGIISIDMANISSVIITFNEEKFIESCLKSLVGVVDEIVVIDSYSTDATKEICLRYMLRFIENKFEGFYRSKEFQEPPSKII